MIQITENDETDYIVTYMVSFTTANGVTAKSREEAKKKGLADLKDVLNKALFSNVDDLDIDVSRVEED